MKVLKINPETELVVALIAAVQGTYLSVISYISRKRSLSGVLLSVVFVSVTIRIVKSLLWVYTDNVDLWILNVGFISHSVYGPALFLFLYCELFQKRWNNYFLLHFIPSFFLLVTISSLTLEDFWYSFGYTALLIQQGCYIVATWILFFIGLYREPLNHTREKERIYWYVLLLLGGFLFQFAYFSNYILGLTPYLMGPMVYAIFLFVTSIFIFRYPQVLRAPNGRKNQKISNVETLMIKKRLLDHMEQNQPFLNPDCTLTSLSKEINTQPYKLSRLINDEFSQNFSAFLNTYRIRRAMEILKDENYANIKISAIAFDCGFNSLSSFNQAFKKNTLQTPSEFRDTQLLTNS